MILKDGSKLNLKNIETLNALGPYSMAIWKSGNVELGNEEGLAGRSQYFLNLLKKEIKNKFSLKEIKEMSILDIGCNDGWVLHQLSEFPFKKMIGIEPRKKNIQKGKIARKILKLKNNVKYKIGSIENLGKEKFDIVICAGLLYHVESIPYALKKVRDICKKMIFIESRCLSSKYITTELKNEIEMRDLIYQYQDKICGLTAQKYESAYYDGSANVPTIVNVPTTETLVMNLNILGFKNINVIVDEKKYRNDVWKNKRPLSGVCISALIDEIDYKFDNEEEKWIKDYESGLEKTVLDKLIIEKLYERYCINKIINPSNMHLKNIINYIDSNNVSNFDPLKCLNKKNKFVEEIIKNLVYKPYDKICLEYGKYLYKENQSNEAILVLEKITKKLNSDWRSVYRSFKLLSEIYSKIGNKSKSLYYLKLLEQSNSKLIID